MPLLTLTITACISKPKKENDRKLPPMPKRTELAAIETTADLVEALNYYEHLVQEWEAWGIIARDIVEGKAADAEP